VVDVRVIVEVFVLALACTVRPTSLAAVYALISRDTRRGLMSAYVIAGLAFTLAFGMIVVGATEGIHVHSGTDRTKAIADIAGGIVALAFGIGLATRRINQGRADDAPRPAGRMKSVLDRRLTIRTAAFAGPATHIPGLFYLVALNVIVAHNVALANKTIALVTFNVVWFALPLAALVACIVRPETALDLVGSVHRGARDHARGILLTVSFGAHTALVIRGILTI
jgi:Sap, sulfolipid-1-addressing protein